MQPHPRRDLLATGHDTLDTRLIEHRHLLTARTHHAHSSPYHVIFGALICAMRDER
jgi:hypothetical protein